MIDKVKSRVKDMIPEGATVVAAVSGGSDSMAMLSILNEIKDEFGFSLCAAHVNHCLRGEAADSDEKFVCDKCAEIGVKLYVKREDVAKLAAEQGIGLEECGRNVRYEFFNSLGDNIIIATAHNLSDRIETFFFNLAFALGLNKFNSCHVVNLKNFHHPNNRCYTNSIRMIQRLFLSLVLI